MKTIGIMLPALRMGGAEVIALNYIKKLCNDFDITIIVNKIDGELLNEVPSNVSVSEDRLFSFKEIIKKDVKHLSLLKCIKDINYYLRVKLKRNNEKDNLYLISRTKINPNRFDVLICFVANVSTQIFRATTGFKASKKIAWIHGETNELKDNKLFEQQYSCFDQIVCVSNITKDHFLLKYPKQKDKTIVLYNPIDKETIIEKSKEECDIVFDKNTFNIVSVGRLSPEKGFTMIPEILKIIRETKPELKINWYLIGDGPTRTFIEEGIKKYKILNLFLLGFKRNPYSYMAQADLYVQPSYEEGYSTTICEAGILGKTILATDCSGGIKEQICDGINGYLCSAISNDIAKRIIWIYEEQFISKCLQSKAYQMDFSNSKSVDIVKQLLS